VIELCWKTDPDKRPSFRELSQMPVFRESGGGSHDDPRQQQQVGRDDSSGAAVVVVEPELSSRPSPATAAAAGTTAAVASWDPYASETEVTCWLKQAGFGRHITAAAASDEDYCGAETRLFCAILY